MEKGRCHISSRRIISPLPGAALDAEGFTEPTGIPETASLFAPETEAAKTNHRKQTMPESILS
jgi:hypothetical protein